MEEQEGFDEEREAFEEVVDDFRSHPGRLFLVLNMDDLVKHALNHLMGNKNNLTIRYVSLDHLEHQLCRLLVQLGGAFVQQQPSGFEKLSKGQGEGDIQSCLLSSAQHRIGTLDVVVDNVNVDLWLTRGGVEG